MTCSVGVLLCGCETWTTYRNQERRLNAFHLRCLRSIMGLLWRDRVPNTSVSANDWFLRPHTYLQSLTSTMGWSCVPAEQDFLAWPFRSGRFGLVQHCFYLKALL